MFGQMSKSGNKRHKWTGAGTGKCVKCGVELRVKAEGGSKGGSQRELKLPGVKGWTGLAPKEALPDCAPDGR